MSIYKIPVRDIDGNTLDLSQFEGKVLLVVNTASKCGFTPQYEALEKVYQKYQEKGLEIIGAPSNQFAEQEPGTNEEVKNFCALNFGVSFPLLEKMDVRGENAHTLFAHLTDKAPFNGFDLSKETDKGLNNFIEANFPEFLEGDSIKWNFTKFLINQKGEVVKRYESPVSPLDIQSDIEALLN